MDSQTEARDPSPDKGAVSTHYRDDHGELYAATVQRNRAAEGVINREKFAGYVRPGDVVLDFGCASGSLLVALEVAQRIGIEVNPVTRGEAAHAGVEVHESLADVPDHSVDVAISNHALEHVLAPHEVLVEIRPGAPTDGPPDRVFAGRRLAKCSELDAGRS